MAQQETYLTAKELSQRWSGKISPGTLANWRCSGTTTTVGPPYLRIGNKVLYALSDVEAWEAKQRYESTAEYRATPKAA